MKGLQSTHGFILVKSNPKIAILREFDLMEVMKYSNIRISFNLELLPREISLALSVFVVPCHLVVAFISETVGVRSQGEDICAGIALPPLLRSVTGSRDIF